MKLSKLLFLPLSSIAVVPCVSLASCSNAVGVKNVSAELYYSSNPFADGIEFIVEYDKNVASCNGGQINGKFAKLRWNENASIHQFEHISIGVEAIMIDGTIYTSTIELDAYYNYAMGDDNYLTDIKNVKIINWQ